MYEDIPIEQQIAEQNLDASKITEGEFLTVIGKLKRFHPDKIIFAPRRTYESA